MVLSILWNFKSLDKYAIKKEAKEGPKPWTPLSPTEQMKEQIADEGLNPQTADFSQEISKGMQF